MPVLVINDSPIKQFAENTHAVGQSVFESYMRLTNRSTQGKRVVVFGYGSCGRGVAANFRNAFAQVTVLESDPVKRLEACLDGFDVSDRAGALAEADVIVTITGHPASCSATICRSCGRRDRHERRPFPARDRGRRVLCSRTRGCRGARTRDHHPPRRPAYPSRRAGPHGEPVRTVPLGNSIESMDLGFALQSRSLEAIARGTVGADSVVVPVPKAIDDEVASAYLREVVRVSAPVPSIP